jgi:hypothetical protein
MKNTYDIGHWVIGWHCDFQKYRNKAWKIYNIKPIPKGDYDYPGFYLTPENDSHVTSDTNVRLATGTEIINAGGTPKEIELNYEIY